MPMGFLNEVHEPPFFYGMHRPEIERLIVPSTWREVGTGLFGDFATCSSTVYAVAGLNATGFSDAGLRGGRQQGNASLAEDFGFVGRLDLEPIPELSSAARSSSATPDRIRTSTRPATDWTTWPARHAAHALGGPCAAREHGPAQPGALHNGASVRRGVRSTLALRSTGDIGATEVVAGEMLGVYGELGYEILQWIAPSSDWTVEPFVRVEHVDTQHRRAGGLRPRPLERVLRATPRESR